MRTLLFLALLTVSTVAADLASTSATAARFQAGQTTEALRELDQQIAANLGNRTALRQVESALARLLQEDATAEAKLFACQRLAIIGTDTTVPALAPLLTQPETVGMACLALAAYPPGKANAALRETLLTQSGTPQTQIIAALGQRRDPKAVPALQTLARTEGPSAEAAILALGRIGNPAAQKTLASLRNDRGNRQSNAINEASLILADHILAKGDRKAATSLYRELSAPGHPDHVRAGAFIRWLQASPQQSLELIENVLRKEDPSLQPDAPLRNVALAAIGTLPNPDAPNRCANLFPHLTETEQIQLQAALADFGPRAPRTALASRLSSPNPELRLATIRAFARLNDPADLPIFAEALSTAQTPTERQALETALAQLPGGTTTDQSLIQIAHRSPGPSYPTLLSALARRGATTAIPLLLVESTNPAPAAAKAAWQGLARLARPTDLPVLIDHATQLQRTDTRDEAVTSLAQVLNHIPEPAERFAPLVSPLNDATDPAKRAFLVRLLPLTGSPQALNAAQQAAQHPNPLVRDAGIRALAEWPTADAWDTLTNLYQTAQETAHRTLTLRGLVRLLREQNTQAESVLPRYRHLLEIAQSDEARKLILGALGGCTTPGALELALAQIEIPGTREEAAQAIRRIADALKATHPAQAEAALQKLGKPAR
jgi:hypothetical protein